MGLLGLYEFYVDYVSRYVDASKFLLRKILPTRCFSDRKTVLVFPATPYSILSLRSTPLSMTALIFSGA